MSESTGSILRDNCLPLDNTMPREMGVVTTMSYFVDFTQQKCFCPHKNNNNKCVIPPVQMHGHLYASGGIIFWAA